MKKILIFTCLLLSLSLTGSILGAVLVDLDASGLTDGDLASWANTGTAGGAFAAISGGGTVTSPQVLTLDGKKCVVFEDQVYMESDVTTPAALTGPGSPWTVMIWANADSASGTGEDSMFQMADRGGVDARIKEHPLYSTNCHSY